MKSDKLKGLVLGIIGVILFSAKAVLVKLAYTYEVDTLHLLLFRMLFALPFYLIIAFTAKPIKNVSKTKKDYLWIVFLGIIGYYLASYLDFVGLQYLKASLERVILFCYPTIVVILSLLIFKKRPDKWTILSIILAYTGILIIFGQEVQLSGHGSIFGGVLVFLSAVTYASYLVGSGWLIPRFGVVTFTSYSMVVACTCVIVHYMITNTGSLFVYPKEIYIIGLSIAVFSTVIPSYLVSASIKRLGASDFSILSGLGPVSTIILASVVLEERITLLQLTGIFIVIIAIVVISVKQKKK